MSPSAAACIFGGCIPRRWRLASGGRRAARRTVSKPPPRASTPRRFLIPSRWAGCPNCSAGVAMAGLRRSVAQTLRNSLCFHPPQAAKCTPIPDCPFARDRRNVSKVSSRGVSSSIGAMSGISSTSPSATVIAGLHGSTQVGCTTTAGVARCGDEYRIRSGASGAPKCVRRPPCGHVPCRNGQSPPHAALHPTEASRSAVPPNCIVPSAARHAA